jgi:hypothetical protein
MDLQLLHFIGVLKPDQAQHGQLAQSHAVGIPYR